MNSGLFGCCCFFSTKQCKSGKHLEEMADRNLKRIYDIIFSISDILVLYLFG